MSSSLPDNAREAAERAADPKKETDDPRLLPTTDDVPKPPSLEEPTRIIGEYEVLGPLGCGGMGEVYKARHRRLHKLVALKLLPADMRNPREAAVRFQREMKAVGDLDHPNVVEAHDAGEQSGVIYLAMKLIDGVDLERLVKQRGPLPIAEACELVRQAAVGLHYLHERGLVHRDIKPSNLMRTPDGTVKVLDLGLARWHLEAEQGHSLTGMWRAMGTPDFLAPEQVENAADADARADVYGLGGTLFYLLTGRAPFADHKSQFSKLEAHRSEPPPDVRMLRPDVPADLAVLLQRLLAKKPEQRSQTAAEVAASLAPLAAGDQLEHRAAANREAQRLHVSAEGKTHRPRTLKLAIGFVRGKWSCTLTLAAGLTAAILIGLPVWLWFTQPGTERQSSTQPQEVAVAPSPPPEPRPPLLPAPAVLQGDAMRLEVMRLDVNLTRNVNGGGVPAGSIGDKVFDPHRGDHVTVQSQLTRPAYAFLIAFRPDGQAELCFPEKEDEPPRLTEKPGYPSMPESAGDEYGLANGTGLQVFALVVSSQPLPAYKEWWPQRKGCPWKKEDAPAGIVYRANGEDPVQVRSAAGQTRSKGVEVKGKTLVGRLAAWLRKAPGIETVQVLGFTVGPKVNR